MPEVIRCLQFLFFLPFLIYLLYLCQVFGSLSKKSFELFGLSLRNLPVITSWIPSISAMLYNIIKQGLPEEVMYFIRTSVRDGKNTRAFKYKRCHSFLMLTVFKLSEISQVSINELKKELKCLFIEKTWITFYFRKFVFKQVFAKALSSVNFTNTLLNA